MSPAQNSHHFLMSFSIPLFCSIAVWLHLSGACWGLGFADTPFETAQRPLSVKPRAAARLSNAQGMG